MLNLVSQFHHRGYRSTTGLEIKGEPPIIDAIRSFPPVPSVPPSDFRKSNVRSGLDAKKRSDTTESNSPPKLIAEWSEVQVFSRKISEANFSHQRFFLPTSQDLDLGLYP